MAKYECGLCGRVGNSNPCHCWRNEPVEVMVAAVLASGGQIYVSGEDMRQAKKHWLITHQDSFGGTFFTTVSEDNKCTDCDGLGGIAIVGSDKSRPGSVCQRCRGTGFAL